MDKFDALRSLVDPTGRDWTCGQLEQLDRDLDEMATLLLDIYRVRLNKPASGTIHTSDLEDSDDQR